MSLTIFDGRSNFWQWDTGQKLLVEDTACGEVHFCTGTDDCALVTQIKTLDDGRRVAAVPDILLQSGNTIVAYLYQVDETGARTRKDYRFRVLPRNRPEDYVYPETGVLTYKTAEARMQALGEVQTGLAILDGRRDFWQWDTGQYLLVGDAACCEVHYCNGTDDCALVTEIKTLDDGLRVSAVPNILLQTFGSITAYLYQVDDTGTWTREDYRFRVLPRNRPEDYVYTETEVINYRALEKRVDEIEKNGVSGEQIAAAVNEYLDKNPIDTGVQFETDKTLILKDGILSVNTTNNMEQDNTLPITSAGVYATVGNIEALLKTI